MSQANEITNGIGKLPGLSAADVVSPRDLGEAQQRLVTKTLLDLVAGDRFKAVVRDSKPGHLVLEMADGNLLDAKTQAMPDAHIGDAAVFQVRENAKGQLLLALLKADEAGGASAGVVRGAISAAELPVTAESVALVNTLMRHNAPIHADALHNALFFMRETPALDMAQIAFLVKEGMPATVQTVEQFRAFASGARFDVMVRELQKQIAATEAPVRRQLLEAFLPPEEAAQHAVDAAETEMAVNRHFRMNVNANESPALYFMKVGQALAQIKQLAPPDSAMAARLEAVADGLRFMQQIHAEKQYMQIPYTFDGRDGQEELHVSARRGRSEAVSVLLALDLARLGHVETFIQKNGSRVTLQFRSEGNDVLQQLSVHMQTLADSLAAGGFSVAGVGYMKTDEKFAVDGQLPQAADEPRPVSRYSFDMRV